MGMGNPPMINSPCGGNGSQCAGGAGGGGFRGGGGGGAAPIPPGALIEGAGIVLGGLGIGGMATLIFLEMVAGRGGGGGTAQPPGDGGDDFSPPEPDDLGPRWKPMNPDDPRCWTGCEVVAKKIQKKLGGGQIYRISNAENPPGQPNFYGIGPYRDAQQGWYSHDVVVKNGRVFDGFSDRYGVPMSEYKQLWDSGYPLKWTPVK
jgi:hypothetical protein